MNLTRRDLVDLIQPENIDRKIVSLKEKPEETIASSNDGHYLIGGWTIIIKNEKGKQVYNEIMRIFVP